MSNSDEIKECRILLKEFTEEKLQGELDNLKKYSFFNLYYEKNKKYGFNTFPEDVWLFDPDSSKIANSIYYLVWKDKLPGLSYEQIGQNYRGDTLNTFKTLFGREYNIAKKIVPNDVDFYNQIENFKNFYLTIGNFSLLPNEVPIGLNKRNSINCYRGSKWKDYYDQFLFELDLCLSNSENYDNFLKDLTEANSFYFNKINTITKFKEINFLEGYFSVDNKVLVALKDMLDNVNLNTTEGYKKFAIEYMKKATSVIESRSEAIIHILKNELWVE